MPIRLSSNEITKRLFKLAQDPSSASPAEPPTDTKEQSPPAPPTDSPTDGQEEQIAKLKTTLVKLIGEEDSESEYNNDDGAILSPDDPWYEFQQEGLSKVSPEEIVHMMYPDFPPKPHTRSEPQVKSDPVDEYYAKAANQTVDAIVAFQEHRLPRSQAIELYRLLTDLLSEEKGGFAMVMPIMANAWAKGFKDWNQHTLYEIKSALAVALRTPEVFENIPEQEEEDDLFS